LTMCRSIGALKCRKCSTMMSKAETDWIEDRIYTLLEKLIETSDDKYAVEIRELLEIMNENVRKQRT
jgi:hypothetical protein